MPGPSGLRLVADPRALIPIAPVLAASRPERVLIAIGPEGGWNAFELSLLEAHDFQAVGMGSRTLRVDTACVALLSIAHSVIGRSA
jgi:RsmE family RNA methyltransferase